MTYIHTPVDIEDYEDEFKDHYCSDCSEVVGKDILNELKKLKEDIFKCNILGSIHYKANNLEEISERLDEIINRFKC